LWIMTSKEPTKKPAGISEKVTRLLEVYMMIAQNKFPSIQYIAEYYKVSKRTVFRYLELINFIDSVEYDNERKGYRFVHGDRIKKLSLSDNELLTLFAAGETVSRLGNVFGETFQELANKMATLTRPSATKGVLPIILKMPEPIKSDHFDENFKLISLCIQERRSLDLTYRVQHSKEITERTVDPYGLVFYDGIWILIAFCHLRKLIRSFALDRIIALKERWRYFTPLKNFDLNEYLSHSWGIVNDTEVEITARFARKISDYILRKDKWHPSENRVILSDGSVELTFTVAGADEIKRWIYSWLPDVEVTKPKWLRDKIREELSASEINHS
jgi:predicted DNA-binding transcriptional regulator YafY